MREAELREEGIRRQDYFVQCCAFDFACAATDTGPFRLFCPLGPMVFGFQDLFSRRCTVKNCQSFGIEQARKLQV